MQWRILIRLHCAQIGAGLDRHAMLFEVFEKLDADSSGSVSEWQQ